MKNLIAFALAGLLAVSTAASMPPVSPESLPNSASETPAASSSSAESTLSGPELPTVEEVPHSESLPSSDSIPAERETEPSTESSTSTDSGTPAESAQPENRDVAPDDSEPLEPVEESIESKEAQEAEAVQESEPARFSEELCRDLADEQAGSLMGHYGLERSTACITIAATLALADYEMSDNLDRNYVMVWAALQSAVEALAADGHTAANCAYQDGAIVVFC